MASKQGFNDFKLEPEVWTIEGPVYTDSSGVPTNTGTATTAPTDQNGDPLVWPRGITSVTKSATGVYLVALDAPWWKLKFANAVKMVLAPQATLVGTVDLTTLTLSTVNGKTLLLTPDDHAEITVTFTTPTSVADIAAQINTQMAASAATHADILNGKYLRIRSATYGVASTMACNATSTGDTTFGISNTGATGQTLEGTFKTGRYNERGSVVHTSTEDLTAQTIEFIYEDGDGVATNVVSSGFWLTIDMKNVSVP